MTTSRPWAWDTETERFRPGVMAPELVCLSHQHQHEAAYLTHHTDAEPIIRAKLEDKTVLHVGAHIAYDFGVVAAAYPHLIPLIFQAYDDNRVTDVQIRQKLLDIAGGEYRGRTADSGFWIQHDYNLAALASRCAGIKVKKEGFRLFYGFFRDVPLDGWVEHAKGLQERGRRHLDGHKDPQFWSYEKGGKDPLVDIRGMVEADPNEVITYPQEDARVTLEVFLAQEAHREYIPSQFDAARSAWRLHLTSLWGLRTSPEGVRQLKAGTEADFERLKARLIEAGLVRGKDGTRDTKVAKARMEQVCADMNREPRKTKAGGISLDSEACDASEDPVLQDYAKFSGFSYVWSKDIPALEQGIKYPIHTRFDIAETSRKTSSKPNVQNWRRLPGVRECFVPREGWVYFQADYPSLELRTLAQVCVTKFGASKLADALNAGVDPHTQMASTILGVDLETALGMKKAKDPRFDNARQTSKVANFGFPGGLGAEKLVLFAKKTYDVTMSVEEARDLKALWKQTWPEMEDYFAYVDSITDRMHGALIEHLHNGMLRGGASYTAACNSFFQHLGATTMNEAGWLVAKACYVDRSSPLFGSRIVNDVHDELIGETRGDDRQVSAASNENARLMAEGARIVLPDIQTELEPVLMRFWSKVAATVFHPTEGHLLPWEGACVEQVTRDGKTGLCDSPAWFRDTSGNVFCEKHSDGDKSPIRFDGVVGTTKRVAA